MKIHLRLPSCCIWSILMYGHESRTINKEIENRLKVAEMSFLRKMLRVSYVKGITNEEVLQTAGTFGNDREIRWKTKHG